MLIDVIDDLETFKRVQPEWEQVYDADLDGQFFLSWTWLSKWLVMLQGRWFILAAKPAADAPYVAFFPLRIRLREDSKGVFYNEINMCGNFAADYTGFICRPEYDERAISAFARHMKRQNWRRMNLDYLRTSDARMRIFMSHFSDRRFETRKTERINKRDNVNNTICPYVSLPGEWDGYLATCTSTNMRQKLRRFLRQIEADASFRIEHSEGANVEPNLRRLLEFWKAKWGARKGDRLGAILQSNFEMLMRCSETGHLFLPMLWQGDRPLGGLASMVDPQKKTMLFYVAGRDESFNDPPPGLVLHAHSIRYAISRGLTTYDFLRGNEPYKYSFGAKERLISCIVISTRSDRNLGDKLDRKSINAVFERAVELHKAGNVVQAERGYRQVIDTDPEHARALYCLGQLMAQRGKYGAAKRLFTTLTALRPKSEKAWSWLARTLEARQRLPEAADAYRALIALNPDHAKAHNRLGNVLVRLRRFEDAVKAYDSALTLDPDYLEADVSRANTMFKLGTLPEDRREHYAAKNAELGDRARESGATVRAMDWYRQAIALSGSLARAHYGLAQILQGQGHVADAQESYRKAAEIDPDYRDVVEQLVAASQSARAPRHAGQIARP